MSNTSKKTIERAEWSQHIDEEQWGFYREVLDAVSAKDIPFALGGGFALAAYTQRWRNSKDIDLVVQPKDRDAVIEILTGIGYGDFYDRSQYERYWIYRSTRGDNIVDVIWGMRNKRAVVDEDWLNEARSVCVCDRQVKVLSPEILVWGKLYVVIRDRSDWPDVFNIIYGAGPTMPSEGCSNASGAPCQVTTMSACVGSTRNGSAQGTSTRATTGSPVRGLRHAARSAATRSHAAG
jgi:hypothetical protein